jgi:hypothetical protein
MLSAALRTRQIESSGTQENRVKMWVNKTGLMHLELT